MNQVMRSARRVELQPFQDRTQPRRRNRNQASSSAFRGFTPQGDQTACEVHTLNRSASISPWRTPASSAEMIIEAMRYSTCRHFGASLRSTSAVQAFQACPFLLDQIELRLNLSDALKLDLLFFQQMLVILKQAT
jgi:hypothetical protein